MKLNQWIKFYKKNNVLIFLNNFFELRVKFLAVGTLGIGEDEDFFRRFRISQYDGVINRNSGQIDPSAIHESLLCDIALIGYADYVSGNDKAL